MKKIIFGTILGVSLTVFIGSFQSESPEEQIIETNVKQANLDKDIVHTTKCLSVENSDCDKIAKKLGEAEQTINNLQSALQNIGNSDSFVSNEEERTIEKDKIENYFSKSENDVDELVKREFPEGDAVEEWKSSSGKLKLVATDEEGVTVSRELNPEGTIVGETMNISKNEHISKSYHENGFMKGFLHKKEDSSMVAIAWGQNGNIEGRTDTLSDGTTIVTKYDSSGNLIGRWIRQQDGKYRQII